MLAFNSRSMSLRAASALFSWICQLWVRRSVSPKDSEAFARAARSVSIFCFWASICLFSTSDRAVSASTELSFLSNSEDTSFISEPSTLKDWLISASAFLNSFSPSRPIFKPKLSAIWHPHLQFCYINALVLVTTVQAPAVTLIKKICPFRVLPEVYTTVPPDCG